MNFRSIETLFLRFRDQADGAALAAVFDASAKELFEVAGHLVHDRSAAEDLVQATFLTAIRKADQFDGTSPLKGWLYGILWREAAKLRRSSARRVDPRNVAVRESIEPIEELETAELSSVVRRALAELPRTYREVIEPLVRDGSRPEDIARALGRSPGTVRSQIHRGMQRLRRALPAGLAPTPAFVSVPWRGLADVRRHVLQSAGVPPATIAAGSATALSTMIGGTLMSKTILVGSATFAAAFVAGWFGRDLASDDSGGALRPSSSASSGVAAASLADAAPADESVGLEADASARRSVDASASAAPARDPEDAVRYWRERFAEKPDDWRHGLAIAYEVAKLPPAEALRIMSAVWPSLSVPAKEQALKPFVFQGGHAHALPILRLAATDASLSVQGRAFTYLKDYAFRDFATDYQGYLSWAATYEDMPLDRVLTENAQRFVADLLPRSPREIAAAMRSIDGVKFEAGKRAGVDLAAEMRRGGALRLLEACLQGEDVEAKSLALEWTEKLRPDESWLRAWVLPAIESPGAVTVDVTSTRTDGATNPSGTMSPSTPSSGSLSDENRALLARSFAALSRPDCGFAREPILAYLRRAPAEENGANFSAAQALAAIGDPASIPAMIEILVQDKSGKLGYAVGYYGLARMTGVTWQESCDGEWWLDWWTKNQGRFAPEVAAIPIRR